MRRRTLTSKSPERPLPDLCKSGIFGEAAISHPEGTGVMLINGLSP